MVSVNHPNGLTVVVNSHREKSYHANPLLDKWHNFGYNIAIWLLGGNYDNKDKDF